MVEQIVDFVLGFVICGLIGLAFLPLVSARARRLTLARIESRLPMTFDEIEADRDLLRARFAVENRALEVKAEQAGHGRVAEAAELGRRAVALMRVTEQLTQTTAQLNERNAELAKSLEFGEKTHAELHGSRETLAQSQADMTKLRDDYGKLAEERQSLDRRVKELDAGLAAAGAQLKDACERLETSEASRKDLAARLEEVVGQNKTLAADLVEAERRGADFEARRTRMLAKIAAERKRAEDLENANLDLRRRLIAPAPASEGEAANGAEAINGAPGVFNSDQELLDLREAISRLGRQVARMDSAEDSGRAAGE